MSDEVIGTAVLAEIEPSKEMLFVLCHSPSRKYLSHSAIPVCEIGKTHGWEPGKPVWDYRVNGSTLDVKPSLRIMSGLAPGDADLFHNAGAWSIPFVRRSGDDARDSVYEINRELRWSISQNWEGSV